jgi:hypothetical protein
MSLVVPMSSEALVTCAAIHQGIHVAVFVVVVVVTANWGIL